MANLIEVLLQRGSNSQFLHEPGFEDFPIAVITGREEDVNAILQTGPDLEAYTMGPQTPLHLAAEHGHAGVVKVLLEEGAKPHAWGEPEVSTPFYCTAQSGSVPAMELLYQAGSNNRRNDE